MDRKIRFHKSQLSPKVFSNSPLRFSARFEERAGSVIAPHHPILDVKPVDDVGLRGLSQFHRVNHARRIIDLAGKLAAIVGKRSNPKIFDALAFANGNFEREAQRARLWRRGDFEKIRERRLRLAHGGAMAGSVSATLAVSSRAAFSNTVWAASGVAARRLTRTMNGVFPANIDVICALWCRKFTLAILARTLRNAGLFR